MKEKARSFAIASHGDQMYGHHGYYVHLDAVAKIAIKYGENAVVISYLHDVVEDTDVSVEDIEKSFGKPIADCVAIVTDEPGKDRKERKTKTYAKMAKVTGDLELALIVKAADRLANITACQSEGNLALLQMYKEEHQMFRSSVYRESLCDDIWIEIEQIIKAPKCI